MRLQIVSKSQVSDAIVGFQSVVIDQNNIDLSNIVDNECELILASEVFDSFTASAVPQLVQALISKLRFNGSLVVGGTSLSLFCKAVSNGLISPLDASNVVTNLTSMTSSSEVKEACQKLGLQIESVHVDGLHYEVKAKRVK
jgi:hypothetical protein